MSLLFCSSSVGGDESDFASENQREGGKNVEKMKTSKRLCHQRKFAYSDCIIPAFPVLGFFPEKGKLDHQTGSTVLRRKICKPQIQDAVVNGIRPIAARPMIG